DVSTVVIPHLTVNTLQMTNVQVPALNRANVGALGLLGIDALQSRRVLVDFRDHTMTLTPSVALKKEWKDNWAGETIIVSARRYLGQLILTKSTIDNTKVDVIVDTGLEV